LLKISLSPNSGRTGSGVGPEFEKGDGRLRPSLQTTPPPAQRAPRRDAQPLHATPLAAVLRVFPAPLRARALFAQRSPLAPYLQEQARAPLSEKPGQTLTMGGVIFRTRTCTRQLCKARGRAPKTRERPKPETGRRGGLPGSPLRAAPSAHHGGAASDLLPSRRAGRPAALAYRKKNFTQNSLKKKERDRYTASARSCRWPLCTARCWGAVDRGADAAAAPSRAARDGVASAPKQTGGRGAGAAAKASAFASASAFRLVAVAHARDPRRSARTRRPGFEPAAQERRLERRPIVPWSDAGLVRSGKPAHHI